MPLRVLIVDDNRDSADSLAALVGLWGHTAAVAYDGETGLRLATADPPDCLLLDISMPGVDGYTLARRLREAGLGTAKLVAVSALSHPDHARRAAEAGFDYRLTKPADPAALEGLLRMVEAVVGLAERADQLAREVKEELRGVREEVRDVRQDVQGLKEEVREIRRQPAGEGEGSGSPPPG